MSQIVLNLLKYGYWPDYESSCALCYAYHIQLYCVFRLNCMQLQVGCTQKESTVATLPPLGDCRCVEGSTCLQEMKGCG